MTMTSQIASIIARAESTGHAASMLSLLHELTPERCRFERAEIMAALGGVHRRLQEEAFEAGGGNSIRCTCH